MSPRRPDALPLVRVAPGLSRWHPAHQGRTWPAARARARRDVVAQGDPVVAVVLTLAQQAPCRPVPGHRDEEPHVGPARGVGDGPQGGLVARGGARSASGGTTMRSTATAHPATCSGQAILGQQLLEAAACGRSSCSTALSAPSTASWVARPSASCGSWTSRWAVCTRANSRTGWSHPARATWRSVSSARGSAGRSRGGVSGSPPHGADGRPESRGRLSVPRSTWDSPRRRDEESSESLGVVRRASGSG